MKRLSTTLALIVALTAGTVEARLLIDEFASAPLFAPSRQEALRLVRVAMGDSLYEYLTQSRRRHRIAFEDAATIAEAMGISDVAAIRNLGGYYEKDVNSRGNFTIHVNKSWIQRILEDGIRDAPNWGGLAEAEQRRRMVLAQRIAALGIIAHEGMHAFQAENNQVGFKETLVAPGIHDKIAHDKYDEYQGYVRQYTFENRQDAEGDAKKNVNQYYGRAPARFLVVRNGREAEGQAPFPWEGSSDQKSSATDAKSFASFVTEAVALGGQDAMNETTRPRKVKGTSDPNRRREKASLDIDPNSLSPADAEGGDPLGNPGIRMQYAYVCPDSEEIGILAGGAEGGSGETAMAKSTVPISRPSRQNFGVDPTAAQMEDDSAPAGE